MQKRERTARLARQMDGFFSLLSEAVGFRNKLKFCAYVLSSARRRANGSGSSERLVEFRHARVHFGVGAGELRSYIEVFLEDDYEIAKISRQHTGGVIIDVGANIGIFSLAASQNFQNAEIYALEPHPDAYSRLVENLKLNRADNVRPLNRAVCSMSGPVRLSAGASTTAGSVSDAGNLSIDGISLDDLCAERAIDHVGLLKIDVEGGEVEVLRGAGKTLENTDWVVVECHSAELAQMVDERLMAKGFRKASERRVPAGGGMLRFCKIKQSQRAESALDIANGS